MQRAARVFAAFLIAFGAFAFQAVQLPGRALACSCLRPPAPLAEQAAKDPVTIVAGTVGAAQADRTPLVVDTWFHGEFATDLIWLSGGRNQMSSCDVFMTAGERRVMSLWGGPAAPDARGLYSTSLCSSNAAVGTAEGDALLAEAVAAFGTGQPPPSPEPEPAAPIDLSPWIGDGLIWAAVAVGVGLAMFGAVALIARRRPQA